MRVNIWIRKEDEDRWNAIADKPEWLHDHLQKELHPMLELVADPIYQHTNKQGKRTTTKDVREVEKLIEKDRKMCQHGAAIGFCKHGCTK